ncbi:MAG: helix-turn-helix transcriptional regulator [Oscillochloris sp.]|nr:helix-turn-helix transcriptional regulator [Oscillochloris sp.]
MQKIAYTKPMHDATARLFKALMHPTRLQILDLLRGGEQCVCHLEAHLGQPQAYVSQQLAVLRKAGLVCDQRDGLNIYYGLARPEVLTLLDTARAIVGEPGAGPAEAPVDCPCPRCTSPRRRPLEPLPVIAQE